MTATQSQNRRDDGYVMPVNSSKNDIRISLRIVVYREGKHWLAHCLEMDIIAEGDNSLGALANLLDLMALQLRTAQEEGEMRSVFRPAPPEIWQLYSQGTDLATDLPSPSELVDRLEARELSFC